MGDSRVGTVSECFKYFSREMPYWCTMTHYTLCFRICVDVEKVSDKTGLDSPPQFTPWTVHHSPRRGHYRRLKTVPEMIYGDCLHYSHRQLSIELKLLRSAHRYSDLTLGTFWTVYG